MATVSVLILLKASEIDLYMDCSMMRKLLKVMVKMKPQMPLALSHHFRSGYMQFASVSAFKNKHAITAVISLPE